MKTKYFLLSLSIIYSLSFSFWSIWGDTYYWINHFDLYKQEFMTILSMWLGQQWCLLFGKTVISTRMLSWLLCSLAMLIPYFFLQNKTERKTNIHLIAIGYIFMGYGNYNFYNPDATTTLTLSALSTFIICYIKKQHIVFIILLSLISAISFSFRFPNIVALPWISVILFLTNYRIHKLNFKNNLLIVAIYSLISLLGYYCVVKYLSNADSVIEYAIDAIVNQKVGPTHSLSNLIWGYAWDLFRMSVKLGLLIITAYSLYKFTFYKSFKKSKLFLSCAIFTIIMILYVNKWGSIEWIRLYSFGMIIFCIFITRRLYKKDKNTSHLIIAISLISLGMIGPAGSDTGWLKMFPYFIAFTPIIFKWYIENFSFKIEHKYFLYTCLFISMYTFYTNNYERYSITDMKGYYNHKLIKNIALDQKSLDIYKTTFEDINNYTIKDKIIFYGVGFPHHLYALTETKPLYHYSFWMFRNDMNELNEVISCMHKDSNVILFDFSKSDNKTFLEQLTKIKSTNYYTIYKYNNGN